MTPVQEWLAWMAGMLFVVGLLWYATTPEEEFEEFVEEEGVEAAFGSPPLPSTQPGGYGVGVARVEDWKPDLDKFK